MRELAGIVLCIALLLGITAGATELLDDRTLMVSAPDATAEQFIRAVSLERYGPAEAYLADGVEIGLRALQAQIGRADQVEAETVEQSEERALVEVKTESQKDNHLLYVTMEWDGEWKVDEVAVSY